MKNFHLSVHMRFFFLNSVSTKPHLFLRTPNCWIHRSPILLIKYFLCKKMMINHMELSNLKKKSWVKRWETHVFFGENGCFSTFNFFSLCFSNIFIEKAEIFLQKIVRFVSFKKSIDPIFLCAFEKLFFVKFMN